jgi:hypothetical protein
VIEIELAGGIDPEKFDQDSFCTKGLAPIEFSRDVKEEPKTDDHNEVSVL